MISSINSIKWRSYVAFNENSQSSKWASLQKFSEFLNGTSVCRTQSFNGNLSKLKILKQGKEGRISTCNDLTYSEITLLPPLRQRLQKSNYQKSHLKKTVFFFLKTLLKTLLLPCLKWCNGFVHRCCISLEFNWAF